MPLQTERGCQNKRAAPPRVLRCPLTAARRLFQSCCSPTPPSGALRDSSGRKSARGGLRVSREGLAPLERPLRRAGRRAAAAIGRPQRFAGAAAPFSGASAPQPALVRPPPGQFRAWGAHKQQAALVSRGRQDPHAGRRPAAAAGHHPFLFKSECSSSRCGSPDPSPQLAALPQAPRDLITTPREQQAGRTSRPCPPRRQAAGRLQRKRCGSC